MLDTFIKGLESKNVGFVGIGISNTPIIKLLLKHGIHFTVRSAQDVDDELGADLRERGIRIITGPDHLDAIDENLLFLSPGVKQFLPQLRSAKENGTVLTTEMQEFLRLCPCKTIGVTGSDGKTTTTTLIAKLLELEGKRVHLGGNIGKNLFASLDEIKSNDFAVVELSSFQLMKMSVSPDIAVITNISPNHLDWHNGMEEYIEAKKNIYKFQDDEGKAIFNASNVITADLADNYTGRAVTFGKGDGDYRIQNDGIYYKNELLLKDSDVLLPGIHNRENYAAAIAATEGLVSRKSVVRLAQTFGGVEHRIEFVREHNGVKYFNSSIDSSPSRTAAALNSFKEQVIVIAGGYDKNIPLEPLGPLFKNKVKAAILMGNTASKIKSVLESVNYQGAIIMASDMEDAVKEASAIASNGDTVILSPAAASFDLFKNFMERGRIYKQNVNSL